MLLSLPLRLIVLLSWTICCVHCYARGSPATWESAFHNMKNHNWDLTHRQAAYVCKVYLTKGLPTKEKPKSYKWKTIRVGFQTRKNYLPEKTVEALTCTTKGGDEYDIIKAPKNTCVFGVSYDSDIDNYIIDDYKCVDL